MQKIKKLSTVIKKLDTVIREGLVPFAEDIRGSGDDILIDAAAEAVDKAAALMDSLAELSKADKRSSVDINRLSLRVFERDGFRCQICGIKDQTGCQLSRVSVTTDPGNDVDNYITMCKKHMKSFKKELPWSERTSEDRVLKALEKLVDDDCTQGT